MEKNNIIRFRNPSKKRAKKIKNLDGPKYFNRNQIQALRRYARNAAYLALSRRRPRLTPIREWMCLDILTSTGIRCAECADIRISDLKTGYAQQSMFIRDGKGALSRTIQISKSLKRHLKGYLKWKEKNSEPMGDDDYLIRGQRGPMSRQSIQLLVKKHLKALGLYEKGKSVHSLRHSFAVEYYRQERDLRGLQRQLGHASIQNTMIYCDCIEEDVQRQIDNMWG